MNADDFGLSAGVNRGLVEAHEKGIVTSASLMVYMPAAAQAAALARNRPLLSLGLHTDIGEWRYQRGNWVPVYERVPQGDPLALKAVVDEQVELFRDLAGADPTHLDSHQHVHTREPLKSLMCQLAEQLGIPLRHFNRHVSYCGDFYGQDGEGRPLSDRLTPSFLTGIMNGLNEGVTELGCHPAAEVDFESPYGIERLRELEALCSPTVHEAMKQAGVMLASFRSA